MERLIALVVATSVASCGLTQTRGPDPRQPLDQRPVCTDTFDAPKRDSIGAVLGFVGILVGVLFLKVGEDDDEALGATVLVSGVVVMGASYASGGVGYLRVRRCKAAIAEFERRNPPPP